MRSQSFFFNSWIYRSNLRSQRSSEIDVSLVLAQKKERKKKEQAKLWTVCEGEGKKISKKSTGPGERVQFSKVKSSGVTRRPSFPSVPRKWGKSFSFPERTEADIDYYTPSRIEMRLENFSRTEPRF